MKVRDIHIEGFGVWSGLHVDSMPDSMTVFYGPNEAGKTTLMQFLRSMFYGYTNERKIRYLPPVNGGRPGGAIRVTGPGGGYEISRRARLDDPGVQGELIVSGSDGSVQGQHRLAMLLGQVDETIFTNVFAIGLRELQELNTLDDTSAADELYKLSSGLDRVSLVDVIRKLKTGRKQIAGPNNEDGQMQKLMQRREKLRDELDELNGRNRRWNELASQRRAHDLEIEDLRKRTEQWELESKTVETALLVREPWQSRNNIISEIENLAARPDIPDDAGDRLNEILVEIEEKQALIDDLKVSRKKLRDKAMRLPVRKSILDSAAKIEAASEQSPWITTLQKQIQRLEADVESAREELTEDAKKLGLTDEDRNALLNDKRLSSIPDLSRQSISQLAEPARDVRVNSLKLKQAKEQGVNDKKESDRLTTELAEALRVHGEEDLHVAIQKQTEFISKLRGLEQAEDKILRLKKHRDEMEDQAVDLAAEEALPVERTVVLAIPFVFGGCMLLGGMAKCAGLWFKQDASLGVFMIFIGFITLFLYWSWRNFAERGNHGDLDEHEDQLETLIKQTKRAEKDRDEIERSLPNYTGTLEQRLRESEHKLSLFEKLLPVYHNQQAAMQRYQSARKQAAAAASELKSSKNKWRKNLNELGLAKSLSPKSIRNLADGYDSLLQSRTRLKNHEDQLDQRKLELVTISQRVEELAQQVSIAIKNDGKATELATSLVESVERAARKSDESGSPSNVANYLAISTEVDLEDESIEVPSPVRRLQELNALLTEQRTYIKQRRDLKSQDDKLAKQQKQLQRGIEKLEVAESATLTEFGVESSEHLDEQLVKKRMFLELDQQRTKLDEQVHALIGGNVPYETVANIIEHAPGDELDKRLETLAGRVKQSEERIEHLLQRQGETTQEMKTLAADFRLSEVKLEIACIEKQLESCSKHWQTLAATTQMLETVCDVYENERQPETLREASGFLSQLTEGKYVRVWTPLGKNALRIDNDKGQSLPLEVLSRGTREAVFIALRLSLAAAYSRRGVMIPLVMDDVLVNFDAARARSAARVLRDFAQLGHQVIMFTCHEHIMRMFYDIDVQVRVLPQQGVPGEAHIFAPHDTAIAPEVIEPEIVEPEIVEPEPIELELPEPEPVIEQEPMVVEPPIESEPEPTAMVSLPVVEIAPKPAVPKPKKIRIRTKPRSQPKPAPQPIEQSMSVIDHLWYELEPGTLEPVSEFWYDQNSHDSNAIDPKNLESVNHELAVQGSSETVPDQRHDDPELWWENTPAK